MIDRTDTKVNELSKRFSSPRYEVELTLDINIEIVETDCGQFFKASHEHYPAASALARNKVTAFKLLLLKMADELK